jgi:NAD(P)H dehydrogenase (quinone)
MIAVTGATGHLGRLIIQSLIARGTSPAEIVAVVRSPEKAVDLSALGVEVREGDYDRPETLVTAFAGIDRLVFVSASTMGVRVQQHRNAIEAAKAAGVGQIIYTSILKADTSPTLLAQEHRETEEMIRASGIPFVFLRNGGYTENYEHGREGSIQHGALIGSAGSGQINAAERADYAEAAAVVAAGDGHEGAVYELAGDTGFTMDELAAELTRQAGKPVVYHDMPVDEYAKTLAGFGIPELYAKTLADADGAIPAGMLQDDSRTLSRLIGRPTAPMPETIAQVLKAPAQA